MEKLKVKKLNKGLMKYTFIKKLSEIGFLFKTRRPRQKNKKNMT